MNTFNVNGKEYVAKAFDFNLICDLEDMGIPLEEMSNKPMSMVRAYLSKCGGFSLNVAGEEIGRHIVNGGQFDEILDAMQKEMNDSDFFRSLNKTEKQEDTPIQKKASTKK